MAEREVVLEWADKAEEDYLFALQGLSGEKAFYGPICFHFQQAAEKYLKAFIVSRGLSFSKIHDLTELLAECRKRDGTLSVILEDCDRLTDYYIEPRYPTAEGGGVTQEEADEARRAAQKVRDEIRKRLGL